MSRAMTGELELNVLHDGGDTLGYVASFAVSDQLLVAAGGTSSRHPFVCASSNARHFEALKTPRELGLRDILAVGDALWVCGEYGQLACSRDGGQTWKLFDTGTDACLFALALAPDGAVWVVGDGGYAGPIEALERGYIDLLLTIDYAISSDHPSQILFEDDYVVVGAMDNPAMQQEMTRELYFSLGHVTARFGKARVPAFEDWFVRRQKQQRRVEVVAPTFLSLPGLVVGTRRVATMHRHMAQQVVQNMPLVMREVPFAIPPIREAIQWHITNNNDRALKWVVERFILVAERINGAAGSVEANDAARKTLEIEYRIHHPQH